MSEVEKTTIAGLEELLRSKIPHEIVGHECVRLTRPGDNYGSEMLALNVTLRSTETEKKYELLLVAKKPPKNEQLLAIFQTSRTFIKENCTYTEIVPCVRAFEAEVGLCESKWLDVFCECFGARISLSPNSRFVDEDALLLLRNLKPLNFRTGDRLAGFDSEHSKLILTVNF